MKIDYISSLLFVKYSKRSLVFYITADFLHNIWLSLVQFLIWVLIRICAIGTFIWRDDVFIEKTLKK